MPDAIPTASAAPDATRVRFGSAAYWRITLALVLAAYATFSLLYCTQPLLPILARTFGVGAAASSLALSLSTGCLAISVFLAGALSETVGRKGLMFGAMCLAAALNLAAAVAPSWEALLVVRALEGVALGGTPAVGMAYLADEIEPEGLGFAMGLYVAGNALGGMSGRVIAGVVADHSSWEMAMAVIGGFGLLAAIGFLVLLPPSRRPAGERRMSPRLHLAAWLGHLRNPGLPPLFALAFLLMGSFVTIYNYAGFRLEAPPFGLTQSQIGLIFVVYLFGMASSSGAGWLSDRIGRAPVVLGGILVALAGVGLTLAATVPLVVAGIALLTIGFFGAHSAASGWVARIARGARGHASALYLLAYYLGSSVLGSAGGWFWTHGAWGAVGAYVAVLLLLALAAALYLARLTRGSERAAGRPAA